MVSPSEGNEVRRDGRQGVGASRSTDEPGEPPEGPWGGKEAPTHEPLEGNMTGTPRPEPVFTKQQRIAELAGSCRDMAFTNLAHHIDLEWMLTAHARTRKDGAVGVDGQTAEEYEGNLESNLQNLLDRAKSGTYVAPPVRRVHIPKAGSATETRPLGIPICRSYCTSFQKSWGLSDGGPAPPSALFSFLRPIAATTSDESACAGGRCSPASA
jgi:hypothetical protein